MITTQPTRETPNRTAHETAPVPADNLAGTERNAAYERGLRWHLASTEHQLSTFESASPGERARMIETILAQNRMYALAAERAGEPQLARVLRAFAPVLESVARDGGEPSLSSLARMIFELRVIQARLSAETPKPPPSAQPLKL